MTRRGRRGSRGGWRRRGRRCGDGREPSEYGARGFGFISVGVGRIPLGFHVLSGLTMGPSMIKSINVSTYPGHQPSIVVMRASPLDRIWDSWLVGPRILPGLCTRCSQRHWITSNHAFTNLLSTLCPFVRSGRKESSSSLILKI